MHFTISPLYIASSAVIAAALSPNTAAVDGSGPRLVGRNCAPQHLPSGQVAVNRGYSADPRLTPASRSAAARSAASIAASCALFAAFWRALKALIFLAAQERAIQSWRGPSRRSVPERLGRRSRWWCDGAYCSTCWPDRRRGRTAACVCQAETIRIRPLPLSAISRSPAPSTATPIGPLSSAAVAGPPSPENPPPPCKPSSPLPATV